MKGFVGKEWWSHCTSVFSTAVLWLTSHDLGVWIVGYFKDELAFLWFSDVGSQPTLVSVLDITWMTSFPELVGVDIGRCDVLFDNSEIKIVLHKALFSVSHPWVKWWWWLSGKLSQKDLYFILFAVFILQKAVWCVCFYGNSLLISGSSDGSIKVLSPWYISLKFNIMYA